VRIALVGDSTQTNHAGYGLGFCANLVPAVDCVNMSQGGASTKSYRDLGLWSQVVKTRPDYALIQFGHNNKPSTPPKPDRQTSIADYESQLRAFITEARSAGIKPVLVTPLVRLNFDAEGRVNSDMDLYAIITRRVASSMDVPLIDLHAGSSALIQKMGPAKTAGIQVSSLTASGKIAPDHTHLNWAGSFLMGRIVAEGLARAVPELQPDVLPNAAPMPPEGEKAMRIFEGGRAKIVLVGDSTVNPENGWGAGFCPIFTRNISCKNDAVNGESSKSFLDHGLWARALKEHGDYYLIQFGHNDQPGKGADHETIPETTYADNLRRYIRDAQSIGAIPVLVTPLMRRTYKDGRPNNDLIAYAQAMKKVARETGVSIIDLNYLSLTLLQGITQEQADGFDAPWKSGDPHPLPDRTHLNRQGQRVFGRMVATALAKLQVELWPSLLPETTASQ
jgi:lysophospholipase L1-like esterase